LIESHQSRTTARSGSIAIAILAVLGGLSVPTRAHDIPNQRIDRSTQVTLSPGKLAIDYEVSLTELTLTQDLRRLIGALPGRDRSEWLARYGEETGPLNARGFLIHRDGLPVTLRVLKFDLLLEEHPRYTFRFEADLPDEGRLVIHDTNYLSSEGTSRLALRSRDGVVVESDDLPTEVAEIPIRPVWQLSDEEEQRTRRVEVQFRSTRGAGGLPLELPEHSATHSDADRHGDTTASPAALGAGGPGASISRLLDPRSGPSFLGILLIATALGAVHSIQPGHGKSVVSAIALGAGSRWFQPLLLAFITSLAHTLSVLLIAAGLWLTRASQVAQLHHDLTGLAGFTIAAFGFWRIGRTLSGVDDHPAETISPAMLSSGGLLGLGLVTGLVPCWDAVSLLVLSAAIGKLGTGVLLVLAFGAGMAGVLIAVGLLANRLRSSISSIARERRWTRPLNLAGGGLLAMAGLSLFLG